MMYAAQELRVHCGAVITLYREITTMSATTLLLEKPQVKVGPGVVGTLFK